MTVTVTELVPTVGVEIVGPSGGDLVDRRVADDCLAAHRTTLAGHEAGA